MRFCMVTTYFPPYHFGGDAVFVQRLARDLVAEGHHVEVVHGLDAYALGTHPERELPPAPYTETIDGIVVHRMRSRLGPLSPLITQQTGRPGLKHRALKRVFDRGFDVVNFHNISLVGGPGALEMDVVGMHGAPVKLYTLHEHWLLCSTHIFWKNGREACQKRECLRCSIRSGIPPQLWRYSGWLPRAVNRADMLLSPSEFTAQRHREAGFETPIRVLPTYADDPVSMRLRLPAGRPRFLFAGRVVASKGIPWLAELFRRLPQYDLDILGDGPLREPLSRQYADAPWIRFHGAVGPDKTSDWYAGATALIVPSIAPEVFPLSVLEAFAVGTPAIVSPAGGNSEAVEASGAGFVYRDEASFLEAVNSLAASPELRRQLGRRAREAFEHRYCKRVYLDGYLGIIEDLLRRKRASAEACEEQRAEAPAGEAR